MFSTYKEIDSYGLSYIGRRASNQDCYLISDNGDIKFFAVADGMGGMAAGELASKRVLETAKEILTSSGDTGKNDLKFLLKRIFTAADNSIQKITNTNPEMHGMGTTLCCMLVKDDAYVYGNIGDSRLYHINGTSLNQLTEDHTFTEKYLKQFGPPVPPDVKQMSHIIYRALNGEGDEPDIFPINEPFAKMKQGDAFLICSDGLFPEKSIVEEPDIKRFLTGLPNLKTTAEQLICESYYNGSQDNITVVLLTYGKLQREILNLEIDEYPPVS